MDTHKLSMEKLKEFLTRLHELCKLNIILIRQELRNLKDQLEDQKMYIENQRAEISAACERSNQIMAISFREDIQRMTVDHELEMSDIKNVINNKDEEISVLKTSMDEIKVEREKLSEQLDCERHKNVELLEKYQEIVKEYESKLSEAEVNKQKEIKELQERMHMDYRSEVASIRSR